MRKFIILAHPTGATHPEIPSFVRTISAKSKALAIDKFFSDFGPFNFIEKVVEVNENEEEE